LLTLFAGMVVLSQQYEWVEKRVDPVKRMAMEGASRGVQTRPRVATSLLGVSCLFGAGAPWGAHPPAARWGLLDTACGSIGACGAAPSPVRSALRAVAQPRRSSRGWRGTA